MPVVKIWSILQEKLRMEVVVAKIGFSQRILTRFCTMLQVHYICGQSPFGSPFRFILFYLFNNYACQGRCH